MLQQPDRFAIESDLTAARRRAQADAPGSPAWDAAMAWIDDLERELSALRVDEDGTSDAFRF